MSQEDTLKRNARKISEIHNFKNPHVRFIRKNGRVIPIVNKKRVGEDVWHLGSKSALLGVGIAGGTLAVKYTKSTHIEKGLGLGWKATKKGLPIVAKATLKAFRHSGKIGLAMAGVGIFAGFYADRLLGDSGFGSDYTFFKPLGGKKK